MRWEGPGSGFERSSGSGASGVVCKSENLEISEFCPCGIRLEKPRFPAVWDITVQKFQVFGLTEFINSSRSRPPFTDKNSWELLFGGEMFVFLQDLIIILIFQVPFLLGFPPKHKHWDGFWTWNYLDSGLGWFSKFCISEFFIYLGGVLDRVQIFRSRVTVSIRAVLRSSPALSSSIMVCKVTRWPKCTLLRLSWRLKVFAILFCLDYSSCRRRRPERVAPEVERARPT